MITQSMPIKHNKSVENYLKYCLKDTMIKIAALITEPNGKAIPVVNIIKSLEYVDWNIVEIKTPEEVSHPSILIIVSKKGEQKGK